MTRSWPPPQPPRGTLCLNFRTQEGTTASKEGCPSREARGEVASSWWSGLARTSKGGWEGRRATWTQEEAGLGTSQESSAQREQPHTCPPGCGGETKAGDVARIHPSSCPPGIGLPKGTCPGAPGSSQMRLRYLNLPQAAPPTLLAPRPPAGRDDAMSDHPIPHAASARTLVHWTPIENPSRKEQEGLPESQKSQAHALLPTLVMPLAAIRPRPPAWMALLRHLPIWCLLGATTETTQASRSRSCPSVLWAPWKLAE